MTLHELESIFRPFGQIITSRILSDNVTGLSKGVGFVRFDKKDEADTAIKTLNGSIPTGCAEQITVKFANNPASNNPKGILSELEAVQQAATTLVPLSTILGAPTLRAAAGGIGPMHHTPITSKYRYSPMGAITAVSQPTATLPADYLTTSALIQMSQLNALAGLTPFATAPDFTATLIAHQQQQQAVAAQQQQQQQHVQQAASPPASNGQHAGLAAHAQLSALSASVAATLPPSDTAGYCLFVYNLASDTDDTLLWQLFSQFGAIINVKILRDLTQKCKGYAFVSMSTYTEAYNAMVSLNGTNLAGKTLQVVFKSSTPYRA